MSANTIALTTRFLTLSTAQGILLGRLDTDLLSLYLTHRWLDDVHPSRYHAHRTTTWAPSFARPGHALAISKTSRSRGRLRHERRQL